MKTAIVYYSQHHGNTKKLIDAIAEEHEVTLIDVTKDGDVDLSQFKLVGGLQKGHPDADEIAGAVKFFEGLR